MDLAETQHAVTTVINDDERDGKLLLRHGGEITAGIQEATVTDQGHDWADVGGSAAERSREAETERAPADRVREFSWARHPVEPAGPVARNAHIDDEDAVRG